MYMSLVRAKLLFFTLQTKEMKVYFSLCSKKQRRQPLLQELPSYYGVLSELFTPDVPSIIFLGQCLAAIYCCFTND